MSLNDLLQLIPPPDRPAPVADGRRWTGIEQALGTPFPADFRDLITAYGSGEFKGSVWLEVLNPLSAGYADSLRRVCGRLRKDRGLVGRRDVPYGVYPDRPGWLPWGEDLDGNLFCWVTEGPPDRWPTLLISRMGTNFQQVPLPVTSFLARLLSGQFQTSFWSDVEAEDGQDEEEWADAGPPRFVPAQDRGASSTPPLETAVAAGAEGPPCPCQIEWLPPDACGRPTGLNAVLGPGTLHRPREEFTVYPAWWGTLPSPRWRWVRGQLLGWRLGGPAGTALHNLIPLSSSANLTMRAQEGSVAVGVQMARVLYRVRLMYEGLNAYPARVTLEARAESGQPYSLLITFPVQENHP